MPEANRFEAQRRRAKADELTLRAAACPQAEPHSLQAAVTDELRARAERAALDAKRAEEARPELEANVCLIPAAALLTLAESWASAVGGTLHFRRLYTPAAIAAMEPREAGLMAAACELFDLVCAAPGGTLAAEHAGFAQATSGDPLPQ